MPGVRIIRLQGAFSINVRTRVDSVLSADGMRPSAHPGSIPYWTPLEGPRKRDGSEGELFMRPTRIASFSRYSNRTRSAAAQTELVEGYRVDCATIMTDGKAALAMMR
jgi:hypothetical protein